MENLIKRNVFCLSFALFAIVSIALPITAHAATVTLNANAIGNYDLWTLVDTTKVTAVSSNDGDTSYINETTQLDRQTFSFPGAGVPAGSTINSVTINVQAKRAQSGGANINLIVTRGAPANDTSVGSNENPDTTYALLSRLMTTNPFTAAAWTLSAVNSWQTVDGSPIYFGVRHNQSQSGREARVTQIQVVVDYTPPAADTTPPTDPTVTSTSHTVSTWSADNTIDMQWSGAADNVAVAGYSILWDSFPATLPDTTIDVSHTTDPHSATSPVLATGNSYYFHLRTADTSGNWTGTVHVGPFFIDTTEPSTSIDSGPAEGSYSNSGSAAFGFSGSDADSGLAGFECQIDGGGFSACTSPRAYSGLSDGSHTFEVRAVDAVGNKDATPAARTWTVDTTPPVLSITGIVKFPVSDPAESALVSVGGNNFIKGKVQIQATAADPNLDDDSLYTGINTNPVGDTALTINLPIGGTPGDRAFTADFYTITVTNDGPNKIIVSAEDLAGNTGTASAMVMVDNTSPSIGSLTMDKPEYVVVEPIILSASGVLDELPADALSTLDSIDPAPSTVGEVGATVTTTAGPQTGALAQDGGDPSLWQGTFSADAAGPINAEAQAADKVGNKSELETAYAIGLDPTNLICESASVASGRAATLFLGTLLNTTPDPDAPVAGEPVLVEILNGADVVVFSDTVITDADGKVWVSNTFNLPHGSYTLRLTYAGSEVLYLAGSSCKTGFLVRSLANGGGHVALGDNPKTGKPFKGTFGFYFDLTSGFAANDPDGLLNDPVTPATYAGAMNYVDHQTKEHIQAVSIDGAIIGSDTVTFSGDGRSKFPSEPWLGVPYQVTVTDNGEPGNSQAITASQSANAPDEFYLETEIGGFFFPKTPDPVLRGGNIEVRP